MESHVSLNNSLIQLPQRKGRQNSKEIKESVCEREKVSKTRDRAA